MGCVRHADPTGCVRQVWLMKPNGQRSSHLKPNLFPLQKHRPSVWPHSSVPSSSQRHSSLHPSPQMPGAQGRHSPVTWWQVVPLEQEHVSVQLEPHLPCEHFSPHLIPL